MYLEIISERVSPCSAFAKEVYTSIKKHSGVYRKSLFQSIREWKLYILILIAGFRF